ncbi:MAG: hypothetical protein ABIY70_18355 [Capsulimonas sp.]|uniref:hypothetical protein n=1 Tax=Capsulimonas sp. TaxID=2494211 RepID=UPI003264CD8C
MSTSENSVMDEVEASQPEGRAGSWLWIVLPAAIYVLALAGPGHTLWSGLAKIYVGMSATTLLMTCAQAIKASLQKVHSWDASVGWGPWFARVRLGRIQLFWRLFPLASAVFLAGDPMAWPKNTTTWKSIGLDVLPLALYFGVACALVHKTPSQILHSALGLFSSQEQLVNLTQVSAFADSMSLLCLMNFVLTIFIGFVIMHAAASVPTEASTSQHVS